MKRFNIIGAGRVGKTLARLIALKNIGKINSVYNRTQAEALKSVAFIGDGRAVSALLDVQPADITFITTPDDYIESTCEELLSFNRLQLNSIIAHCSGTRSSDVLAAAKKAGCETASVHPIHSFAHPATSLSLFRGTYCGIEGSATHTMQLLFESLGAKTFPISKENKALYHAAGVFAANFLVTLYHSATECLHYSNVDHEVAHEITLSLMQNTLANLEMLKSSSAALTGPIKRGDTATVGLHVDALNNKDDRLKNLYAALGKKTIELANHDENTHNQLNMLLDL